MVIQLRLLSEGFAPMNSGRSALGKIHNSITSCCSSSIDRLLDFGIFISYFFQTVSDDCFWNTIPGVLWIKQPPELVSTLRPKLSYQNTITYNNKQIHFNQMLQLLFHLYFYLPRKTNRKQEIDFLIISERIKIISIFRCLVIRPFGFLQASCNIIEIPEALYIGCHNIWDGTLSDIS